MKSLIAVCAALVLAAGCAGETTSVSTEQTTTSESTVGASQEVVQIDLEVGKTTGSTVLHTTTVGSTVRISITNPSDDDEYHLHGYDLSSGEVPAGETATIEFIADVAGSFELESHHSGELLMTLVVE